MVLADSAEVPNKIKSIAHKNNITILRITSARMLGSYGFMSALFQVFERFRTVIDVISTPSKSAVAALILDQYSRTGRHRYRTKADLATLSLIPAMLYLRRRRGPMARTGLASVRFFDNSGRMSL
ncbi:MAG: hypothetical protein IPN51_17565 [Chloracidobacterium sp.]|nr:hypothetical protein [Chloracidobacterium sp.]